VTDQRRKLAFGDFDLQGRWLSRYTACWRFLEVVAELFPNVLEDLAGSALSLRQLRFRAARYADELLRTESRRTRASAVDQGALVVLSGIAREWAARHNLGSPLVLAAAVHTLRAWASDGALRAARRWSFPSVTYRLPDSQLSPIFPEPLGEEFEKDWLPRAKKLWHAREAEIEQQGYARSADTHPEHFEWLARFQVGEQHWTQISPRHVQSLSVDAIRKAASRIAQLIELPLRRLPRGGARRTRPTTAG
jgi:hypothetical protein